MMTRSTMICMPPTDRYHGFHFVVISHLEITKIYQAFLYLDKLNEVNCSLIVSDICCRSFGDVVGDSSFDNVCWAGNIFCSHSNCHDNFGMYFISSALFCLFVIVNVYYDV